MKTLALVAMGAATALAAATFAPATADAKAKCVMAGGTATGLTQDIAKTMATNALNQSIGSYGGKAAGKVAMKCDANMVMSTCTAKQRACK